MCEFKAIIFSRDALVYFTHVTKANKQMIRKPNRAIKKVRSTQLLFNERLYTFKNTVSNCQTIESVMWLVHRNPLSFPTLDQIHGNFYLSQNVKTNVLPEVGLKGVIKVLLAFIVELNITSGESLAWIPFSSAMHFCLLARCPPVRRSDRIRFRGIKWSALHRLSLMLNLVCGIFRVAARVIYCTSHRERKTNLRKLTLLEFAVTVTFFSNLDKLWYTWIV